MKLQSDSMQSYLFVKHNSFIDLKPGDKVKLQTAIAWAKGNVMEGGGRGTRVLSKV